MKARYINPFTDFGFKMLFGEEVNKDLLIDFLNGLLPEYHKIKDLQYKRTDQLGRQLLDRRAVFDFYCQSENGDRFIVEMQKARQNFFRDRSVFYSTFPIREQADRGDWDFNLSAVYCIGILDFIFDETKDNSEYFHKIQLKNEHNKVFYDKLTFVYIEMPKFKKEETQLENEFDRWLYFIKNLEDFDNIPTRLQNKIFEKAFQTAEIARFVPAQMEAYEDSLKVFRDNKNVFDYATTTAFNKGIEEGKKEGIKEGLKDGEVKGKKESKIAIAKILLSKGLNNPEIQEITGLSEEEIKKIKR